MLDAQSPEPIDRSRHCWISAERLQARYDRATVVIADYPHPGIPGKTTEQLPVLPVRAAVEVRGEVMEIQNVELHNIWQVEAFLFKQPLAEGSKRLVVHVPRRGALNPGWRLVSRVRPDLRPAQAVGRFLDGQPAYAIREADALADQS